MIDTEALRNKVIDLALQGKLTQQLPEDGNAEELFAQIKKESVKAGKIKQVKPISEIKADEIPFKIPNNWKWVRMNDLYEINPRVDAESDADAAFIPMEMISAGFSKAYSYETQKWEVASKNHMKFQNGDVAFAKISPCFENRKSFIAQNLPGGVGGGTTELIILRQMYILPDYTYYVISDQRFISAGSQSYKGIVGQQRVKPESIRSYLVALPPLEEQRRIVNIIETAFTQIDKIDTLQQQYESDREILKGKIIDAGIRGMLTEQLPEDGNAEDLYAHIQKEKANLIKEGKIKKEKPLPEISDDEIPFNIPQNWKWVRLGSVLNEVIVPQRDKPKHFDGDIPWCRIEDADGDFMSKSHSNQNVSQEIIDEMNLRVFPTGTILSACSGGSIGRILITTTELCTNQTFNGLVCSTGLYNRYLFHFLKNSIGRLKKLGSGAAMEYVSQKKISEMIVPFPPYEEQKRIVDTIETVLQIII